jgi:hypothetical protein
MSFWSKLGSVAERVVTGVIEAAQRNAELERRKIAQLDRLDEESLGRRLDYMMKENNGRISRDAGDLVRALERRGHDPKEALRDAYIRTGTRPPLKAQEQE